MNLNLRHQQSWHFSSPRRPLFLRKFERAPGSCERKIARDPTTNKPPTTRRIYTNTEHFNPNRTTATMHLMYTMSPSGERLYTLKKVNHGEVTKSAHPARFSPDDKYSRYA